MKILILWVVCWFFLKKSFGNIEASERKGSFQLYSRICSIKAICLQMELKISFTTAVGEITVLCCECMFVI